jgi:hypothetical protein
VKIFKEGEVTGGEDLKHICLFSGGAASSYMSWLVVQEYGKENTILLHTPTYTEHEDADRFRRQVAEYIGIPITPHEDGRNLWEVIDDNHCLPSDMIPFCTRILKLEPRIEFLKSLNDEYVLYYGFDIKEYLRAQNVYTHALVLGETVKFPLIEKMIMSKDIKKIIVNEWGICLPEPYKHLKHNNCIPCYKASTKEWKKYWKYYPERFELAVEKEKQIGHTTFKGISLEQLADIWSKDGQMPLDLPEENIPCMCAL